MIETTLIRGDNAYNLPDIKVTEDDYPLAARYVKRKAGECVDLVLDQLGLKGWA